MEEANQEELERQLSLATKVSSKKLVNNLAKTKSAYIVHETSEPDSFCSGTLSWYNPILRNFTTAVIILVVLCLYFNSYLYFFSANPIFYILGVPADIFYTYLVFLRSRTGHMIDGVEERNLLKVRERYQTSLGFFLDFLSLFPVSLMRWFVAGSDALFYVVGRQKSYVRLYYVLYYIGIREEEPGSSTLIYRTLKYILLCSLIIHFTACGWYGLACSRTTESGFSLALCSGESWIMHLPSNLLEKVYLANKTLEGAADQVSFLHNTYVTSLYWSSATATSTGYGDIHAYTVPEKIYSIFAMLVGMAIVYGMTMGGMTSMLTNIDARRSSFVHRYTAFKEEVTHMGVSPQVKDLCLRYFDYLWHRWEGEDVHQSGVLAILPESLQASFSEATFKNLIRKADLLNATDDAFCRNLSRVSKSMVYLENQFIQRSGEIASSMCFIQNGIVEVMDSSEQEVLAILKEGKLFGQILLVFDLPRINSIRCKTNCDVFVLNKHDFRQVLSEYPEAAKEFVEAAKMKCEEGGRNWPMKAPSISDFKSYIEKATSRKRKMSIIANADMDAPMSGPTEAAISTRRMTTVYSTDYEGIDMSRVIMSKEKREIQDMSEALKDGPKPSLVDFVIGGKKQKTLGQRSSTLLQDGTEMIAKDANLEDLKDAVGTTAQYDDPDKTTLLQRLGTVTLVNPKKRFYAFWRQCLMIMGLASGLYTTYMVFFTTVPGIERTYIGGDAAGLPLLSIALNEPNAKVKAALAACQASLPLNDMISCIKSAGGMFSTMITGSSATGYNVTVPAWYDVSLSGYNQENAEGQLQIFIAYIIVDLVFYLNIFINLRTAVSTPNGLMKSFKDIKSHYFKWHRFWLDLLCVFPFEILAPVLPVTRLAKYHAWVFLRANRALNFLRYVPSTFTRWEYSLDVQIVKIRTIKFIVYIYTFTHMCSCFFYFWSCGYAVQSDIERFSYKCRFGSWAWVYDMGYHTTRIEDYIKTMYWASTTMTSTGFGDISASTTTGRMFALATMMIGTLMYGWLVAVIASTVSNSEAAIVGFSNALQSTKTYLEVHAVPKCTVDRVLNSRFIEWHRYHGTATPGIETIGRELPDMLHGVMLYESVSKFIESLPFFHNVDSSFIAMLCNKVNIYHFSEGDAIIYEGDLSRDLYIIKKGHCNVVSDDLRHVVEHLAPADYFGEIEILFGGASPRTVVADTTCELLLLSREDMDAVLRSFPILEAQMESIENDEMYHKQIVDAIALRKVNNTIGIDMTQRFAVHEIAGGYSMYGESIAPDPLVHKLTESDKARQDDVYAGMNSFLRLLAKMFLMPITFAPLSKPYIIYETIRLLMILITLFIVPLQAAILPHHTGLIVIQYLLDGLCLVDQYIKLHTKYFNENEVLVKHPVRTAARYLRSSFTIDLISWFPIEVFAMAAIPGPWTEQQWQFFAILRFGRVLQAYKMIQYFWFWLDDVRYIRRWVKHFSSILYGVIVHHWMACLLFIAACPPSVVDVSRLSDFENWVALNATGADHYCYSASWIGKIASGGLFPALNVVGSVTHQYIVSIYWATATLVCVGYGDISALTQSEMLLATLIMIMGTVYYSSILGDIAANIQTDDMQRGHYKGRLSDILKFFKIYEVNKETQRQVLNYYCYLWDRTQGVSPSYLLRGLPPSLRTSVCQSMYDDMIREAFGHGSSTRSEEEKKETEGFFRLMSTRVKPCLYLKQSVICRRGDVGEEMFFIQRGNVTIMEEDDVTTATVLGPGQHFGEVALLFASPRSRTITALTNCDLNVLSKKDLDDILNKFPKFRHEMTAIAQDRKVNTTLSDSYIRPPSKADLTMDIVYDSRGNRTDGADKQNFAKVLDRESMLSNIWNHLTVIFAFISPCLVVYQAAFQSHSSTLYMFGYLMDAWFALDMVLSFHTSYLDQFSTNVDNREKIHGHYGKTPRRFLADAIANVPIDLLSHVIIVPGSTVQVYKMKLAWLSYLRLIRVLRIIKLWTIFKMWETDIRKDVLVVRMYKFFLLVCIIINTFSSIWYSLACPGGSCGAKTWTQTSVTDYFNNRINGYNLLPLVDSWYWCVATMTSTGYGDIKPETSVEMIYSCFVMVCGKIMIGYVLGMVAATLANDESLRVWYEQGVTNVKKYMTDLKFNQELFDHVIQYYDYMWMKNQGVNVMELFPDLSFSLRADIYNQICRTMVDSLELFNDCPENFKRHLCMVVKPMAFMPGDYICLQGDIRSELYYMHHGIAEAIKRDKDNRKIPLRLILEGENFLCESVLAKVRRPCSLRARTYVDVFSMSMEGLQEVLRYHPQVRLTIIANARRLFPTLEL